MGGSMKMEDVLYLDLSPLHPNILNLCSDLNNHYFQILLFPSHSLVHPEDQEYELRLQRGAQINLL